MFPSIPRALRLVLFLAVAATARAENDAASEKFQKDATRLAKQWFPRIKSILDARTPPGGNNFEIVMVEGEGVAHTQGGKITVFSPWIRAHPDDIGLIVHELTHTIQAYPGYSAPWLVEGIADYVRWYCYEPPSKRARMDPATARYDASYQTTAAFLDWATRKYDRNLVKKLNAALRNGKYSPDIFKKSTGKDVDALNAEWIASLTP